MIKLKKSHFLFLFLITYIFYACEDEVIEKYRRPDWLAGKVYTQVADNETLSTFAKCLRLVGYDTIINVSGSYSVFAPTNEAFSSWLTSKQYANVEAVPRNELARLVKYHIIQNPWSKSQLRSLDIYGWIDTLDVNNNAPRGNKRQTLLFEKHQKYGVVVNSRNEGFAIVDTLNSNWYRRVITDSRKYASFFYNEFFSIYNLKSIDYEYYFNRPFVGGNDIYFNSAKTIGNEIFAENGFVHIIDKVVDPGLNAYQLLSRKDQPNNYSDYLNLVNKFPVFTYNSRATKAQPGANLGLKVDSLFDVSYPELAFDILNEKADPPKGLTGLPENVTIRYHNGIFAPTNAALSDLIKKFISVPNGWGSLDLAPKHIKRIIANSHMSYQAVYPSDLIKGINNGEQDFLTLNESSVVERQYGSNCTFIGLNTAVVPRAFSSVTGPVYLRPGYSTNMYAIEKVALLPALKRKGKDYMLFVLNDDKLLADSSLSYNPIRKEFYVYRKTGSKAERYVLSTNDVRTLLMNHVGVEQPKGLARKEFISNMAGSYIIVNNTTNEVSGTAKTTEGFQGYNEAPNYPRKVSENADNGTTYEIDNWFNFSTVNIYTNIKTRFPLFFKLIEQTGLAKATTETITFLSDNDIYTIFAPSDEAMKAFSSAGYTKEELENFIKLHFVQGRIIFTDGNKPSGYYETMKVDKRSTEFSKFYTQIYIETRPDYIRIKDKSGVPFAIIEESVYTNILSGKDVSATTNAIFKNIFDNAVIHKIDRVLTADQLDTK